MKGGPGRVGVQRLFKGATTRFFPGMTETTRIITE